MSAVTKIGAVLALVASLGACTMPAVIADASDSAVWIQGDPFLTPDDAYLAEARHGCGMYGKSPEALSTWENIYVKRALYACT
jgi:hypothetical protein